MTNRMRIDQTNKKKHEEKDLSKSKNMTCLIERFRNECLLFIEDWIGITFEIFEPFYERNLLSAVWFRVSTNQRTSESNVFLLHMIMTYWISRKISVCTCLRRCQWEFCREMLFEFCIFKINERPTEKSATTSTRNFVLFIDWWPWFCVLLGQTRSWRNLSKTWSNRSRCFRRKFISSNEFQFEFFVLSMYIKALISNLRISLQ